MKQIYTRSHSGVIRLLRFFQEIVLTPRYSLFAVLLSAFQIALVTPLSFAQNTNKGGAPISIERLAGEWLVKDAKINMLVQMDDSLRLKKENCFWSDHLTKGIPVKIDKSGNVSYSAFGQPASSKVKIEEGNNLVFMFFNGNGKRQGVPVQGSVSTTTYNVQFSGRQMTLSREDGMVTEKYIFERQ